MPKELMPIVDKPLIQYAAEEAVAAGIDTLIFVTGRNKRAIEDHFDANKELEDALRAKGKIVEASMIESILPPNVQCIFVRQAKQLGLGHAVLCAERVIDDEPFAVLLADDFLNDKNENVTNSLVENFLDNGKSQLSVMKVEGKEISKYGVIIPGEERNSVLGVVEKPKFKDAPSDLACIGRYVLSPKIFDILRSLKIDHTGEIQLADAIDKYARTGLVESLLFNGIRFDCGSQDGYVRAVMAEYNRRRNSVKTKK